MFYNCRFCCWDHKCFFLSMLAPSDIYIKLISFINTWNECLPSWLYVSIITFLALFSALCSSASVIRGFCPFPRDISPLVLWCLPVMPLGVFQGLSPCCVLLYTVLSVSDSKEGFPRLLIMLKSGLQRSEKHTHSFKGRID